MLTSVGRVLKFIQRASIVLAVFYVVVLIFTNQFKGDAGKKDPNTISYVEYSRRELYRQVYDIKPTSNQQALFQYFQKNTQCTLTGELCTDDPADMSQNFNNSVFGLMTQATSFTFNRPASGIAWAGESLEKVGFIPKSQAQGIGFSGILPLSNLWKVFRDLAYMLIVLFVISIGFMIMFRAKINPQTVISIENSLPRVVITLLTITFSFPIAGLMIDLMYVIMGLGISLIARQFPNPQEFGFTADFYQQGTWNLFDAVFINGSIWKTGPAIVQFIPLSLQWLTRVIVGISGVVLLSRLGPVNKLMGGDPLKSLPFVGEGAAFGVSMLLWTLAIGILAGAFFPYLISVIVFLTALFIFFRILVMLISTYVKILLLIVLAPIMILMEMIPGQDAFIGWFKNLFVLLLTFPLVGILIAMSVYITSLASVKNLGTGEYLSNGELWKPPFLYAQDTNGFTILIGVSLLFLIPDLVRYVRESFGIKDSPLSISPGTLLAGGATAAAGGIGLFTQIHAIQAAWMGPGHGLRGFFSKDLQEAADKTGQSQTNPPGKSA